MKNQDSQTNETNGVNNDTNEVQTQETRNNGENQGVDTTDISTGNNSNDVTNTDNSSDNNGDNNVDSNDNGNDNGENRGIEETLNNQITELNNTIKNIKTEKTKLEKAKDKEISDLKEKLSNLNNNLESEIKSQYNVNDKDYFDYLINKERGKEENNDKSLKELISGIKETNEGLFTKVSTPGSIPSNTANNENEISASKYRSLSKSERLTLLNKGVKIKS